METPASQDLMESMVSRVLQVLRDQQAQEHLRETEETLDCQVSLVPLVGKEKQDDLEVVDSLVALVLKVKEVRVVSVVVQVSRVSLVTLVIMEIRDQKDSEDHLVVRVFLALLCQGHLQITIENMETWEFLVKVERLVHLESPVSLECLGVQVVRGVLVLLVNWGERALLVFLDWSVNLDLLDSLDPLENKGNPVQPVVLGHPEVSAAATALVTPW